MVLTNIQCLIYIHTERRLTTTYSCTKWTHLLSASPLGEPWLIHSGTPNNTPVQIQCIIIRKPASFPGNEDHCSDLSALTQAEMRKLPAAHYIMVMPWQRLLLRSSALSQLPRLRQARTTGCQLIIFPRLLAAMLPQTVELFPSCTFCLFSLEIPNLVSKRNGFISPSVT